MVDGPVSLVAHRRGDEAAAISLAAFLAQSEDVRVDSGVDGSVLVQKGEHLVLARCAPRRVREIAVCGARNDLGLVQATRVARHRRVVVSLAGWPSCDRRHAPQIC